MASLSAKVLAGKWFKITGSEVRFSKAMSGFWKINDLPCCIEFLLAWEIKKDPYHSVMGPFNGATILTYTNLYAITKLFIAYKLV